VFGFQKLVDVNIMTRQKNLVSFFNNVMKDKAEKISGAILAGGENKRFDGVIKSNIFVGGSTIMNRIIDTISDIFDEIIIVTNTPDEFNSYTNCMIFGDQYKKAGPLGGIHSALKASTQKSVFVFAGDMPFVDKEIIMSQIEYFATCNSEVLVPSVRGLDEPLHAIYSKSIYSRLDEYLASSRQYAVKDFLRNVKVSYLNLEDSEKTKRAFTNINTPEGAEEASKNY
jgi:molybdopterin-guanine dinucleotide biosynthesis protein A